MSTFRISFKSSFVYQSIAIFNIIGFMIRIFISIALWKFVYRQDDTLINYMVLYTMLSNLIIIFYSNQMSGEIAYKISDGSFAMEFVNLLISFFRVPENVRSNRSQSSNKRSSVCYRFLLYSIPQMNLMHINNVLLACAIIFLGHILYIVLVKLFCNTAT